MQRVVDASVVAKWFLPEAHKDKAAKLLQDYVDKKVELTAPDLLVAEFGNLLWKRAKKIKDISASQAEQMFEDFLALEVPLRHTVTFAGAALKLASEKDHVFYDMLYIALAEQNACEFITADEKLLNKFATTFTCLRWIGDL